MDISIAVATGNKLKLQEIAVILGLSPESIYSSRDFEGFLDPVEDGESFAENATIKAKALAQFIQSQHPHHPFLCGPRPKLVISDDSGLEVDALGGRPGIHSARFASTELGIEGNSPDSSNNEKLLRLLSTTDPDKRQSRFVCVIACLPLNAPVMNVQTFHGDCPGRISNKPSGLHGFGYDPLFIPDGYEESMAELGEHTKSKISHRSRALEGFKKYLHSIL